MTRSIDFAKLWFFSFLGLTIAAIIFCFYMSLTTQSTQAQLGGVPYYKTMSINGHQYIVMTYKDSVSITHDASCR